MNFDRPGGDITWISELYSGLGRKGHDMHVYLPLGKGAEFSRTLANRFVYKSPHLPGQTSNYLVNQLFHHYMLPDLSFLLDTDVVQLELPMLLTFSRLSRMRNRSNVVFDLHSITAFDLEPFIPRLLRGSVLPLLVRLQRDIVRTETCIAVSHSMKKFIMKQYKIDGKNIHVVHPGVNLEFADKMTKRYQQKYEWIRSGADFVAMYVGTLLPAEGVDLLIRAMKVVTRSSPKHRLVIVGAGPQEDELRELVRDLQIEANVEFCGWIPYEETFAAQSQADALAAPVRSPSAGSMISSIAFPIKIPQYLASAKPIITTNVGDVPRYIIDGQNGLVMEKSDTTSISNAIMRLSDNEDLRGEMSKECKKMAQRLTWNESVDRLEQIYLKKLEQAGLS